MADLEDPAFAYTRLLLCEGPDDAAFFKLLIECRQLARFHVRYTRSNADPSGGNSKFERTLRSVRLNRGFSKIRNILIVSDNDDNPDTSFKRIQKQIEQAAFGPAPAQELTPSMGRPAITVMMLPLGGDEGNLECVCLGAARNKNRRVAQHVDAFAALIGADDWPAGRRGKMWLRTSLAATCERDPFVALCSVFKDKRYKKADLIPVMDRSFDRIANAIRAIP